MERAEEKFSRAHPKRREQETAQAEKLLEKNAHDSAGRCDARLDAGDQRAVETRHTDDRGDIAFAQRAQRLLTGKRKRQNQRQR